VIFKTTITMADLYLNLTDSDDEYLTPVETPCGAIRSEFKNTRSEMKISPQRDFPNTYKTPRSTPEMKKHDAFFAKMRISKKSSLRPENDPNSSYSKGVRRAKLRHRKKKKAEREKKSRSDRKNRSKARERKPFPEPTARDYDRYKRYHCSFHTESDVDVPIVDLMATLYSTDSLRIKLPLLLRKVVLYKDHLLPLLGGSEDLYDRLVQFITDCSSTKFNFISFLSFVKDSIRGVDKTALFALLGDILLVINAICTSEDSFIILETVLVCIRSYVQHNALDTASSYASFIRSIIMRHTGGTEYTSESFFSEISETVDGFDQTDFFETFSLICSSLLYLRLLPKEWEDWINEHIPVIAFGAKIVALKKLSSATFKFLHIIYDSIENERSLWDILLGNSECADLVNQCDDLLYYKDKLHTGSYCDSRMSAPEYCRKAEPLMQRMKVASSLITSKKSKELFKRKLQVLKQSYYDANMLVVSERREAPFFIYLFGPPGVGKGFLIDMILQVYCRKIGYQYNESLVYHRSPGLKYWEGYYPYSKWFIHLSEVASDSPDILRKNGDTRINEITSLVDTQQMFVEMAFEDKGKIPAIPKGVIADSNSMEMGVKYHRACPSAYLRRPLFIDVSIAPEYRVSGGTQLDPSKLPKDEFSPEAYRFAIRKYKVRGVQNADCETIVSDLTWDELEDYLSDFYETFITHESGIKKNFFQYIDKRNDGLIDPMTEADYSTFDYVYFFVLLSLASAIISPTFALSLWIFALLYLRLSNPTLMGFIRAYLHRFKERWFQYFSDLRNRFQNSFENISPTKTAIAVGGSLTALALWLYFRRKKRIKTESLIDTLGQVEEEIDASHGYPRIKNKVDNNLWNKWINEFSPSHKGEFSTGVLNVTSSVRAIDVFMGKSIISTSGRTLGFGLCKDILIMNRHALGPNLEDATINVHNANDYDHSQLILNCSDLNYVELPNDLIMFRHPSFRFKDRLKHIISDISLIPNNCELFINGHKTRLSAVEADVDVQDKLCGMLHYDKLYRYSWPNHARGKCGSPLIAQIGNGQCIIGIHSAGGNGDHALARPITREELQDHIELLLKRSRDVPLSESYYSPVPLNSPKPRSPFFYEHLPQIDYIGSSDEKVMVNNKSNLQRTFYSPHLKFIFKRFFKMDMKPTYNKPLMKPVVRNGNYLSPFNTWLQKANHIHYSLSFSTLGQVEHMLFQRVLSHIPIRNLKPLTFECAINGVNNDPFIDRMNASTASGYGWKGKKDKFIPLIENSVLREMSLELQERIELIFEFWDSLESYNPIYQGKCKDEPRLIEKCLAGKTRIFFVSPLELVIIGRMLLAPFYSLLVEHGDVFCTCVGINSHVEWHDLVVTLKNFSPLIMEGDFSSYDLTQPIEIKRMVNSLIIRILEALGYNPKALHYVGCYLSESLRTCVELNTDFFYLPGAQASGKYATAEDNSLVLLCMYMYFYLEKIGDNKFFDNCLVRTYGDDSLISVKENIKELFNNKTFQDFAHARFNMTYTSAAKSLDVSDFVAMEDTCFLKRNVEFRQDLGRYVGKLHPDSMYKMLEWRIPSSFITREEQMVACTTSFLWESFFHIQEEEHVALRDFLCALCEKEFPGIDVSVLPSYNKIHGRFTEAVRLKTDSAVLDELNHNYEELVSSGSEANKSSALASLALHDQASDIQGAAKNNEFKTEGLVNPPFHNPYGDVPFMELYKNASISSTPSTKGNFLKYKKDLQAHKLKQRKTRHTRLSNFVTESYWTESEVSPAVVETGTIDPSKMDVVHNLVDHAGEEKSVTLSSSTKYRNAGQDEQDGISNFLERSVEISSFQIPVAAPADTSVQLKVWDIISLEPSVRAKLRNFAYLQSDLEITINISGTPFHYGKILISYQPYPERNDVLKALETRVGVDPVAYRPLLLNYLSQSPGAKVMDVKDNQPLIVNIPYISPKPMHRLFNSSTGVLTDVTSYDDLEDAGSLYIYSINQSGSVSASPTDLSVYIYGRFTNVSLGTLTATQVAVTTESKDDEWTAGPVERTSAAISKYLGMLAMVPEIAPLAVPGSQVFKGISGVASYFGWSKPSKEGEVAYVKNLPFSAGCNVMGMDSALRLTLDPKQSLTVDSSFINDNKDEMIITAISGRESYLTTFSWADSAAPMSTPIWKSAVTPEMYTWYNVLARSYYQPTAPAFACKPFKFWRGTMHYRFEIVASAYHRGKLAIIFDPNIDQHALISAQTEPNKQYMVVVDIADTQTVDVCINWAAPFPWLKTAPTDVNGLAYRDAYGTTPVLETFSGYANGFIRVVPFTQLQSPDSSDVSVNVYVHCPDLEVQGPSGSLIPFDRTALNTESYLSPLDVSCLELNKSSAKTDYISLDHFGEHITSYRAMLKRYHFHERALTSGTASFIEIKGQILPQPNPTFGNLGLQNQVSLYEYLRYAYLGVRGSFKTRLRIDTGHATTFGGNLQTTVTLEDPSSTFSGFTAVTNAIYTGYQRLSGSILYSPAEANGIEFDAPFYSNNLFLFSFAQDYIGTNQDGNMELEFYRNFLVNQVRLTTPNNSMVTRSIATGEDFTLMRFQGSVPFTVSQS
jgi:hypothetical protein